MHILVQTTGTQRVLFAWLTYRTLESPCEHVFLLIRDRKGALKPEVPCLASLSALQAQFEWLVEENITEAVEANLSIELHNLDLYLR